MERQRLDVFLRSGIYWLFLGLFFFLPLLFYRHASEVFEFPKMLFVYAATVIICALWLGRMIVQKRLLIHKTPLDIPILLFLLSQVASTIYSIDPRTSWFGYYGRFHGGLISTISYTLLYYAFVSNHNSPLSLPVIGSRFSVFSFKSIGYRSAGSQPMNRKPTDQNPTTDNGKLITVILSSATLVSLYALLQHFGIDKNFWIQDVVNRVFSTQGQPNWLAAYIVMTMPLAFVMTRMSNEEKVMSNERKKSRFNILKFPITFYFLLIIFFLVLLFTKSRSGLIGLAAADVVFWSLIFFQFYLLKKRSYIDQQRSSRQQPTFSGTKKQYRLTTIVHNLYNSNKPNEAVSPVGGFFFIHSILIVLILTTNNPIREALLRNEIAALLRRDVGVARNDGTAMESGITLRKSEHGGTESGDIRRLVWSGAIQLMEQRPVFGFGPETFAYTYWWVRPAAHNLTSEWNFLYNKAHNEWLNLASNTGLFGLGSHLLLLGWFTIWTLKALKGPTLSTQGRTLSYAFLAALLGVEAVNFFGFSTVTVGAYTYLFMGMAVGEMRDERNEIEKRKYDHVPFTVYCLLFTVLLLVLYLLSQISLSFFADLSFARGRAYLENRYAFQALRPLEIAAELVPDEPTFRSSLAEDEGLLAVSLNATGEQPDLAEKLKNESLQNFEIVEKQHPYSLSFLKTASRIVYSLGVFDPSLYDRGITLSKKAQQLAPTNPSIPYTLGIMSEAIGKSNDAREFYQQALWLKQDYAEAVEKLDERTTQQNF